MKLILSSSGITNQTIANSLINLVGKNPSETKIALIPTAANVEPGNKDWFFSQIDALHKFGYNYIDVVDISASDVDWRERLSQVDVIFVSGGNTFHLLKCIRETGFDAWLKQNLDSKVYVGSSAGSIICTPTIAIAAVEPGDVNVHHLTDLTAMNLVDFEVSPHTPDMLSYEANEAYAKTIKNVLYALDDESAIEVVDGNIKILTEGIYRKYN
jgi:dipeptidase E